MYYRRLLLRYVLSKIDSCDTASDVVKSVNILSAIRWVSEAWSLVHSETISKCFRKAGILSDEMDVATVGYDDDSEDPFLECDVRREIQTHIERSMAVDDRCTLEEYLQGDCNLPVFIDQYNENWDVNFMEELGIDQQDECND